MDARAIEEVKSKTNYMSVTFLQHEDGITSCQVYAKVCCATHGDHELRDEYRLYGIADLNMSQAWMSEVLDDAATRFEH